MGVSIQLDFSVVIELELIPVQNEIILVVMWAAQDNLISVRWVGVELTGFSVGASKSTRCYSGDQN